MIIKNKTEVINSKTKTKNQHNLWSRYIYIKTNSHASTKAEIKVISIRKKWSNRRSKQTKHKFRQKLHQKIHDRTTKIHHHNKKKIMIKLKNYDDQKLMIKLLLKNQTLNKFEGVKNSFWSPINRRLPCGWEEEREFRGERNWGKEWGLLRQGKVRFGEWGDGIKALSKK